jgi:hypothetical protein
MERATCSDCNLILDECKCPPDTFCKWCQYPIVQDGEFWSKPVNSENRFICPKSRYLITHEPEYIPTFEDKLREENQVMRELLERFVKADEEALVVAATPDKMRRAFSILCDDIVDETRDFLYATK